MKGHTMMIIRTGIMAATIAASAFTPAMASQKHQVVQACLTLIGHDPGPADGIFGKRTRAAIKSWQASKGFDQTGYIESGQANAILTECIAAAPEEPKQEKPKESMKPTTQQITLTPQCRDFFSAIDHFFDTQAKYAYAQYDGKSFSRSRIDAAYKRIKDASASVNADYDTAMITASGVWSREASGRTTEEARGKVPKVTIASKKAFIEHANACNKHE